jgi:hypothetical protein
MSRKRQHPEPLPFLIVVAGLCAAILFVGAAIEGLGRGVTTIEKQNKDK